MDKITGAKSKKLTIFEGPDGSGKSTAAKAFAELSGARYVHFSAMPKVGANLGRMYVEAMLPALLGYQDVVFDRCWLSEIPYGIAFREGQDRLGDASRRMLERLALRCGAVVVKCDPGWDSVLKSYLSRKHLEMLENDGQLRQVYDLYKVITTDIPCVSFDFHTNKTLWRQVDDLQLPRHPLDIQSAGNWDANIVIVGEGFADHKDNDSLYQWPFGSFNGAGCSQWLSRQLDTIDFCETDALWVNADQDLSFLYECNQGTIITLGEAAYAQLYKLKIPATQVVHPQSFKRFYGRARYPLLDILQELV